MFFDKKENLQRLNLQTPAPDPPRAAPPALAASCIAASVNNPGIQEAVQQRAKMILDSGRTPASLFFNQVPGGILTFQPDPGQKPIILLFSNPFAARDYLRVSNQQGTVGQIKVDDLQKSAQSYLSLGIKALTLDRCPRCRHALLIDLAGIARWTTADFAKVWATHRAARLVCAEIRIHSAKKHHDDGALSAARIDYEYIRDHFDCGVPYLHQIIGMIAAAQNDEAAKAQAMERLREFGPEFEGPLEFSVELAGKAITGLMANFGMILQDVVWEPKIPIIQSTRI